MDTSLSEKEIIKAEAEKLGFCFSGFTLPEKPIHFSHYQEWVKAGRYAGMRYMAREDHLAKRENPRLIFPECQSILVLGVSIRYDFPQELFAAASFAHYFDYHEQISALCDRLMATAAERIGKAVHWKTCVDSAPVLERSLAVQAGLGWIGRNSMLIHPKFGSTTLLAACLLDLAIEPDQPYRSDHCGNCRRCAEACPTGAIDPNSRTIDANRCIAYQTIENRAEIPQEIGKKCENKVFGCDICVRICPWNRKNLSNPSPLQTHSLPIAPPSDFELTEEEFKEKYRGTPISRVKFAGWKRNLQNALRNQEKDPE